MRQDTIQPILASSAVDQRAEKSEAAEKIPVQVKPLPTQARVTKPSQPAVVKALQTPPIRTEPTSQPSAKPKAVRTATPTVQPKIKRTTPPSRTAAVGWSIDTVRTVAKPTSFSVVVDHTGKALKPRLFRLQSPARLVVDIPGRWRINPKQDRTMEGDHNFVNRIRLGIHSRSVRLVLDLHDDAEPKVRLRQLQNGSRVELTLRK